MFKYYVFCQVSPREPLTSKLTYEVFFPQRRPNILGKYDTVRTMNITESLLIYLQGKGGGKSVEPVKIKGTVFPRHNRADAHGLTIIVTEYTRAAQVPTKNSSPRNRGMESHFWGATWTLSFAREGDSVSFNDMTLAGWWYDWGGHTPNSLATQTEPSEGRK